MHYLPHERLAINWAPNEEAFTLSLPWMSMEIDVEEGDKAWVKNASDNLLSNPLNDHVQKFLQHLKDYPVFYFQPRTLEEFKEKDLQPCPELHDVDHSTPLSLFETLGCKVDDELRKDLLPTWLWDREKILNKARIPETDLYDSLSFVTYLICYRLEWENTSWSGQDGFGQFLEALLQKDEEKFFRMIGWISKQSWYVTMESQHALEAAIPFFTKAKDLITHFIHDEVGHYKFMEQVFEDISLDKSDFPIAPGTKWLLASHTRVAQISPLAFSAMVNLFEAAYYEGEDPISRVIKLSSRPHAARGYDLHYKINQEHRHCDMPVQLSRYLAPQTRSHAEFTLGLFELTLHFLDELEKKLARGNLMNS